MKTHFTVGEFAKLHGISKQTLLFYDKIDLLKPSYIDSDNGYRYYDATQLEILDTIFILKEIGVSLQDIRQYLLDRTTADAITLLSHQKQLLDQMISNYIKIRGRLEKKLETLKNASELTINGQVAYIHCEEQYLYCEEVHKPCSFLETDIAIKRLINQLTQKAYTYNYQIGTMIDLSNIESGNFLLASKVFSMLDEPLQDPAVFIKPAGFYAMIYHKGAYRDETSSYQTLISTIKNDGFRMMSNSYEECLIDNLSTDDENNYITKISIKVI